MRRRYKRRSIQWKAIFTVLLVGNVVFAYRGSRVTALRHVEVIGARPDDFPRVKKVLEAQRGVPYRLIPEKDIETAILREAAVRNVKLEHNLWGGGSVTLQYRKPVVRMKWDDTLAVDSEGVVFFDPAIPPELPTLQLPNNGPASLLTVAGDWDAVQLAQLAVKVREVGPPDGVGIEVDARGEVCLNMNSGRVVLGSCDDLDKKLAVLKSRLLEHPTELSEIKRLILTRPDAPAIVPLPKNEVRSR